MKVFTVQGWKQFKTDAATRFIENQIAETADEALAVILKKYGRDNQKVIAKVLETE